MQSPLRIPRRWKARLWRLHDLVRPPKARPVDDADPFYDMLAQEPAWRRRVVDHHQAARWRPRRAA